MSLHCERQHVYCICYTYICCSLAAYIVCPPYGGAVYIHLSFPSVPTLGSAVIIALPMVPPGVFLPHRWLTIRFNISATSSIMSGEDQSCQRVLLNPQFITFLICCQSDHKLSVSNGKNPVPPAGSAATSPVLQCNVYWHSA